MNYNDERRQERSWNDPPKFTMEQLNKAANTVPANKRYRYPQQPIQQHPIQYSNYSTGSNMQYPQNNYTGNHFQPTMPMINSNVPYNQYGSAMANVPHSSYQSNPISASSTCPPQSFSSNESNPLNSSTNAAFVPYSQPLGSQYNYLQSQQPLQQQPYMNQSVPHHHQQQPPPPPYYHQQY
ncbi:hypothetical protein SSS_00795 [Sarcoptes scabiei]|uniref:Uncharacterized protein n=1 Tax=Sarcoptes scabiei TaxID=52283 RepID=A0A834VHN2_SARSC|nr:hypothetical protein SSS_00795 [Sarcoptes scabiei]